MHVSLRTLLAYEDSLFDPATRRNWERHISSHEAACTLQRLRNVRQDSQLGVPNQDDDANLVAEYLDHISTPRATLGLEHRCDTSDTLLAEVAACHQVVTQHLSEEMVIDHSIRLRCYQTPEEVVDAKVHSAKTMRDSQHVSDVRRCLQQQRHKQRRLIQLVAVLALVLLGIAIAPLMLVNTPPEQDDATSLSPAVASYPWQEHSPMPLGVIPPTQDDTLIVAMETPRAPTPPATNPPMPMSLNSFVHDALTPPPLEPRRRDNPLRVSDAIMAVSPPHAMQATTSTGQSQ